jgi:hypothetical protein
MPVYVWLALALALLVVVAGTTVTVVRTLRTWRVFRAFTGAIGGRLDDILQKAADVEERLEAAGTTAERLDAAVARLRRSTTYGGVLAEALADVRASIGRVQANVPRK